jgi:hypothetical protein
MHILIQSSYTYSFQLYSDVSVAVTTIIRDESTPDQKNAALSRCLSCHTSLYFASPFNTELLMSHFPRVSFVRTQWNRNFITSLKGCNLRVFCTGRRHRSVCSNRRRRLYGAPSRVCAVLADLRITERRHDWSPWSNVGMSGFSFKLHTAYKSGQIVCGNIIISRWNFNRSYMVNVSNPYETPNRITVLCEKKEGKTRKKT